ncbi:GMP synthase, partial [Rhizobium leguminosarum]
RMKRWAPCTTQRCILPKAQQGREHLEGRMLFDAPLKAWLTEFIDTVFEGKTAKEASSIALRA